MEGTAQAPPATWREWLTRNELSALFEMAADGEDPYEHRAWKPGWQDRRAAWELYTELRTRITTQPLAYRSGDEATALDSVYRLFELSRSIIRRHNGCAHFAELTVRVLNDRARPFTAKWHRMKADGHLSSADVRYQFRRELAVLQPYLRMLSRLAGVMAGDEGAKTAGENIPPEQALPASVSRPIAFGIAAGSLAEEDRRAINEEEMRAILDRRTAAGEENPEPTNAVGLALSGGGI